MVEVMAPKEEIEVHLVAAQSLLRRGNMKEFKNRIARILDILENEEL